MNRADVEVEGGEQDEEREQGKARDDGRRVAPALPLIQAVPRHDGGADGADGAGLIDRGDPHDDGAEHGQDERQGRNEGQQHAEGELAVEASYHRDGRRAAGPYERDGENVDNVEAHQHQAGQDGAQEHVARAGRGDAELRGHDELACGGLVVHQPQRARLVGGVRELVGQDDEHHGGRDDLPQRARRADGAGGEPARVAVAQHGRQRDEAHGDHGGAENAGGGGEQRPHQHHGDAEAARNRPEQARHGHQQVLGDLRALQHDAHEHEQGHGDDGVALNLPVDAPEIGDAGGEPLNGAVLREEGAGVPCEDVAGDRRESDGQDGRAGQREGHRVTRRQRPGHGQDQQCEKEEFHVQAGSCVGWLGDCPRRTAMASR